MIRPLVAAQLTRVSGSVYVLSSSWEVNKGALAERRYMHSVGYRECSPDCAQRYLRAKTPDSYYSFAKYRILLCTKIQPNMKELLDVYPRTPALIPS